MLYKYINSVTGHNRIQALVKSNSPKADSDPDKATLFNQYFHSVFTYTSYVLPLLSSVPTPPVRHCYM